MIPASFNYHRASSVNEALDLLKQYGDDARLLAGGHSLLPAMKLRMNAPANLIDIGRIAELNSIRVENGTLHIGAGATHSAIAASPDVQGHAPVLADTAGMIGDVQVRNKGTIGGSLAHADPAADYPAVLLILNASINVIGPNGTRSIAAGDFFQDLYVTALEENEIITGVEIPAMPQGAGAVYLKFAQPASRFALVGCAALVKKDGGTCSEVRVAFTGVGNMPFRDSGVEGALTGQSADASAIEAAAAQAADGIDVLSDHFAGEDYRTHLARVYARRALSQAAGLA